MKALGIFLLILASASLGCGQLNTLNSVAGDRSRYSLEGSALFLSAKEVMASKCADCHDGLIDQSEEWWQTDSVLDMTNGDVRLVVPGDANNSNLFKSLQLNGLSGTRADMPWGGGTLSTAEVETIRDWINAM